MSIVSVASKIQQYRCDWSFTSFLMIVSSMLIRRRESTHHELFLGNLSSVDIAFSLIRESIFRKWAVHRSKCLIPFLEILPVFVPKQSTDTYL